MRAVTALPAMVVAMLVPVMSHAQDRPVAGEIAIGPTFVTGPAADNVGSGFNFQFGAIYKVNDIFGLKVDSMVSSHEVKDEVTAALNVGDGNVWFWQLSGNIVLSTPVSRGMSLYAITGLGVYYRRVNLATPGLGLVEVCNPWLLVCDPVAVPVDQIVGQRSTTDVGMNVGGGINFRVAATTVLFVESRFHYVWGQKPEAPPPGVTAGSANGQFFPVVFGVRF